MKTRMPPAAAAHEALRMALLALILVHLLAILVHLFAHRMPQLRRMMRPAMSEG
jgi:cytochrome b561